MKTIEKPSTAELYETDDVFWLFENARLIRSGKMSEVDWTHIAEELEDMGKSRLQEIVSRLRILLFHLLKWFYQEEKRSNSWKATIKEQRLRLNEKLEDSKNLETHGKENFEKAYQKARELASDETGLPLETFPIKPPFTFEQALDESYLPDKPKTI